MQIEILDVKMAKLVVEHAAEALYRIDLSDKPYSDDVYEMIEFVRMDMYDLKEWLLPKTQMDCTYDVRELLNVKIKSPDDVVLMELAHLIDQIHEIESAMDTMGCLYDAWEDEIGNLYRIVNRDEGAASKFIFPRNIV